jgi:exonuclease III
MLRSSPPSQPPAPPPSQREPRVSGAYSAPLGTHQYPPLPGAAVNINDKPKNQTLKVNINIASLNMNGYAAPNSNLTGIKKWSAVYQTMKENKTAILALQETHLDDNTLMSVHECFRKRLSVVNSKLPGNSCSSAGVVFVINRALIAPKELECMELIKGRALAIKSKWHNDDKILLINVYTPNNRSEHPDFWETIDTKRCSKGLRRPDLVLGDFNVTEEPIDRVPAHLDNTNAIAALRNLHQCLHLEDTWCHAFPHERAFTYRASNNGQAIMSRLDRIYTSREAAKATYDWKITQTSVPTDHWMVSVKYAPLQAPYIGNGCWTMQIPELKNNELLDKIIDRGMTLQTKALHLGNDQEPHERNNPQTLWESFKKDIVKITKKHCSETRGKLRKKIKAIESGLKSCARNPALDTDNSRRAEEVYLAKELEILKSIQMRDKRDKTRAIVADHGEVLGRVWSGMNKDRKPRDLIPRLKVPNQPQENNNTFERDSRRTAKLARDYHESLQNQDIITQDDSPLQEPKTVEVLREVPEEQHLTEQEQSKMDWLIMYPQVWNALRLAKNGTATGLDSCPYELWKELDRKYTEAKKSRKAGFDIIAALTRLFTDIQTFGVRKDSDFASGWMCPIYKKKDPSEICNYRPITLLNMDYKLLTKTLALQLVKPIHKLIHPNQASFIPKCSIFNHIRLVTTIINYAEVMEIDGAIMALDQEKGYDKIQHGYLWSTMEAANLPDHFIKTVKSLYENAFTQVAINRVFSKPFQVTRGVCQGDPLSCLLFDLAIEPLACKLQNCNKLRGLSIPGVENKLIVNLFADDTTVYLSRHDKFNTVESLLNSWCEVSGAKFNIEKTEIIPIGTEGHRSEVIHTRRIHPKDTEPLNAKIHIAKDGDAVCSLGAWIGNHINDLTPWESVIDKINRKLDVWSRFHPTLYGKHLITQAVVGGHTQFLTKAQGMPPHIEEAITKIIRDFVWDKDIHPRISLDYLYKPLNKGGLNLLDIRTRNEAIELVWLRDYLNLTPSRQTWAIVSDILINATTPKGTSAMAVINTFLQSWNPPLRGPKLATLNKGIIRMLKIVKKYNTNLAARRLSPGVRATSQHGTIHMLNPAP